MQRTSFYRRRKRAYTYSLTCLLYLQILVDQMGVDCECPPHPSVSATVLVPPSIVCFASTGIVTGEEATEAGVRPQPQGTHLHLGKKRRRTESESESGSGSPHSTRNGWTEGMQGRDARWDDLVYTDMVRGRSVIRTLSHYVIKYHMRRMAGRAQCLP